MPAIRRVSIEAAGRAGGIIVRLNAIFEPPTEVFDGGSDVIRPQLVRVLFNHPGKCLIEFN